MAFVYSHNSEQKYTAFMYSAIVYGYCNDSAGNLILHHYIAKMHAHIHMHTPTHTHTVTHMHTHPCTHMHMHTHKQTHAHMHIQNWYNIKYI